MLRVFKLTVAPRWLAMQPSMKVQIFDEGCSSMKCSTLVGVGLVSLVFHVQKCVEQMQVIQASILVIRALQL